MRGCLLRYVYHNPTPHSSLGSLRSHSCHLPARSIATSPLWLKTVTCGLFLRCFAPPRRAPSGEGLIKTASRNSSFVRLELSLGWRADEGVRPYLFYRKRVQSTATTLNIKPRGRLTVGVFIVFNTRKRTYQGPHCAEGGSHRRWVGDCKVAV